MRLTVIGCSGSYPGPDSPASCYLVETEHGGRPWRILLDLGNGALGALHRYADPLGIDAVVLSHLHPDHCMDLCGYYVLRKYHPSGAQPRIPVYGPPAAGARMATAYGLDDPGMDHEFDFHELTAPFAVGPFTITPTKVAHPVPAYAIRVEADDRVLTYSGDTAACDGLVEAAKDADVFLCEASFLEGEDNPPGIHLTGLEAARIASSAGVGRLLLTHVPPWFAAERVLADAGDTFPGAELVQAGQQYLI